MSTLDKEVQTTPKAKTTSKSQEIQTTPQALTTSKSQEVQTTPTIGLPHLLHNVGEARPQQTAADFNLHLTDDEDDEEELPQKKGRKNLTDEERQELRARFDHLNLATIKVVHIDEALKDRTFFEMFHRIKERKMYDDKATKKLIQSSYRSMKRNESERAKRQN